MHQINPIFNSMVNFFREDNWDFEELPGKSILRLRVRGKNGVWTCFAQAREKENQFVFYSVLDFNVPPERRQAVAEFLTRANYGLVIGNFEMDFEDGEVRYKTSIDVGRGLLTSELIRPLVYINMLMMDRYLPGIMKVAFGGAEPTQAIAEIEE